ncbi:MAG TPA: hypothetical protein VJK06_05865 [Methyloceanibacter sp.]|nr:hypothetical protein [Methyloceanibacter sp.]
MAKTKTKGRPAGSANHEYIPTEEIPAACMKCGSVNLTRVPGSKALDRQISGTLPSGFQYGAIRWTRKRCECGQMIVVRTYFPPS